MTFKNHKFEDWVREKLTIGAPVFKCVYCGGVVDEREEPYECPLCSKCQRDKCQSELETINDEALTQKLWIRFVFLSCSVVLVFVALLIGSTWVSTFFD